MSGFIALALLGFIGLWGEDIQSCRRTQGTRHTQATNVPLLRSILLSDAINAGRRAQIKALVNPEIPDCFPIPGV